MNLAQKIGNRIKKLRTDKKMSQTELGKKIGGTAKKICNYEKGVYIPSVETIIELSKILSVTADYFLFDDLKRDAQALQSDKELYSLFLQSLTFNTTDKNYIKRLIKGVILQNKVEGI